MFASEIFTRLFGRSGTKPKTLPRSTVEHDGVDKMVFGSLTDGSPRFRRLAIEDAPQIAPEAPEPPPLDFTSATPEEITRWQGEVMAARRARAEAAPYDAWEDLTRDLFYLYHHLNEPEVSETGEVDPAVASHAKIASKIKGNPQYPVTRNLTRDDRTGASMATMASIGVAREALEEELIEQARQSEQFERARSEAQGAMQELESLRGQAQAQHDANGQVDPQIIEAIKRAIKSKRAAQGTAVDIAANAPVPFDIAAAKVIDRMVQAAHEAAENASHLPSFSQGFGTGEPRYESPEQALAIADMWANNKMLREVSERFGQFKKDMRFKRAKRVTGGQDEIVDLKMGDNIRRLSAGELPFLADDDYSDDFYSRYLRSELVIYDTVGEEHAGRGPIVMVCDESGSMGGERIIWAKAICLALLDIARREKRDFAYVGYAGGWSGDGDRDVHSFIFNAKDDLDPQQIVDMASHFFGGGTQPLHGMEEAMKIMAERNFRKADIVLVSDGEATYTDADKRVKQYLDGKGVRIHGIRVGGQGERYLTKMCTEEVVGVTDFELEEPGAATTALATSIS